MPPIFFDGDDDDQVTHDPVIDAKDLADDVGEMIGENQDDIADL